MNQLFYNIAGGTVHKTLKIRHEKKGQQYQKRLFAVSEILNKIAIGFVLIFLLKARIFYLTVFKRKNLSLPLRLKQTSSL